MFIKGPFPPHKKLSKKQRNIFFTRGKPFWKTVLPLPLVLPLSLPKTFALSLYDTVPPTRQCWSATSPGGMRKQFADSGWLAIWRLVGCHDD